MAPTPLCTTLPTDHKNPIRRKLIINKLHVEIFVLSRPIQTHPRPNPPGGPDQNQSETDQPDYSDGRRWVFSPRNRLRRVDFSFYSPKPKKPELTSEKPRFRRETQIPARKIPESGGKKKTKSRPKNPNSCDNSRRSGKILTEFGEISLIPMRFSSDLELSHHFLEFSRRFLKTQTSTNPFTTC